MSDVGIDVGLNGIKISFGPHEIPSSSHDWKAFCSTYKDVSFKVFTMEPSPSHDGSGRRTMRRKTTRVGSIIKNLGYECTIVGDVTYMLLSEWMKWHDQHLSAPVKEWYSHTYLYLVDGGMTNEDVEYMYSRSSIVKLIGDNGLLSLNRYCRHHGLVQPLLSPMLYIAPVSPPGVINTPPHYDGHGGNAAYHVVVIGSPGSHNRVSVWPTSHNNPRIDEFNDIADALNTTSTTTHAPRYNVDSDHFEHDTLRHLHYNSNSFTQRISKLVLVNVCSYLPRTLMNFPNSLNCPRVAMV